MHSSHHVYTHSGSSSVSTTIFNDLNFSTFDDLDILIATFNNLNLLAFSDPNLQLWACLYIYIYCGFLFLYFCLHFSQCVFIFILCIVFMFMHVQLLKCFKNSFQQYRSFNFQQSWYFKFVMVEEKDVCLVEFIGNVGKVEKNCGMPPTSIMHGSILDVENKHMQVVVIHSFAATTNFVEVEVMQLVTIQVQAIAWKPHSQSLIS